MKLNFTYLKMQRFMLLLLFFSMSNYVVSQGTFTNAVTTGAWTSSSTWTLSLGSNNINGYPGAGDTVIINGGAASNKSVTIPENTNVSCSQLTISNNGLLSFDATSTSSKLTVSGNLLCGVATGVGIVRKGTLTLLSKTTVECSKLILGTGTSTNVSVINGRSVTSSLSAQFGSFIFTGTGSGVVPNFTDEAASNADFNDVTFKPSSTTDVVLSNNFSCSEMKIESTNISGGGVATVVYPTDHNSSFTSGGILSMGVNTLLKIGIPFASANNKIPFSAFSLNQNSTIEYNGDAQIIKGLPFPNTYQNLTLSRTSTTTIYEKSLDASVFIAQQLYVKDNVKLLIGENKTLTLTGSYLNDPLGFLVGSKSSNLVFNGYYTSSFSFDQIGTGNTLNDLTINTTVGPAPNFIRPNLEVGNTLNIYGIINLTSGNLVTNNNVTLKSIENTATLTPTDDVKTAMIATIINPDNTGITGDITVETFVPSKRAFRALNSSVTSLTGSIFSNWQESGSTGSLSGSINGNTLTVASTTSPLTVGKHISGVKIPPYTNIEAILSPTTFTISTKQNVTSRQMKAYPNLTSTVADAVFTGTIVDNILTVDAPGTGSTTFTAGQKITGGTYSNTIIINSIDADHYTIGLSIPTTTMYFNGAPAGFGTHITGIAGSDAFIGQYNPTTGLDYTRSGNPSLFTYNNTTNEFVAVNNTKDIGTDTDSDGDNDGSGALTAGKPYFINIRGDRTIDLALTSSGDTGVRKTILRSKGTIVKGDVDVSSSLTAPEVAGFDFDTMEYAGPLNKSFNFIGNPYQARLDLNSVAGSTDGDGISDRWIGLGYSCTVFDTTINTRGSYVVYDLMLGSNNVPGSTANGIIEPNQAFFVNKIETTPTLIFKESDKVTTSNTYSSMFRASQNTPSKILGSICDTNTNSAMDGFILAFSDSFNNTIVAEDTRKPSGNPDETISSLNDVHKMAIDKRNFPSEADEIPLSITQYRLTNYVMKFNVSNFDQMVAYLVDTYTATETTLNNNEINSYPFTVDTSIPASIAENRFKIVFRNSALQTNSNSISAFEVYPNPVVDNKFTIKSNQAFSGKDANVTILNAIGQKVYSTNGIFSTDGSLLVNPAIALSKGIYLVKVAVDGKVETKKLIIK